jgi:hypothetical protein
VPLLPISVYSLLKHSTDDTRCWINNMGGWEWIIYVPNLLSMAVSITSNLPRINFNNLIAFYMYSCNNALYLR